MPSTPPGFVNSQLFTKIPPPTKQFTGQTIIVTGSNVGMGFEAARLFVRLNAEKVILAVRTISKGESAKESIEASEKRKGVVEVWELDHASYASVKAFAAKAEALKQLDVAILNAGMYTFTFSTAEDNERTITVNVISTFLLGLLLLPKLRATAIASKKDAVLTFTGSFTHWMTTFPERKSEHIFQDLARKEGARMDDRYQVSKMIELLCLRELASELTNSKKEGRVIASLINPGYVDTAIMREASGLFKKIYLAGLKLALARPTEVGGRILVSAAEGGEETHGAYLDNCKVGRVSPFVTSAEGAKTQKQLWRELSELLEKIQPGIMQNI